VGKTALKSKFFSILLALACFVWAKDVPSTFGHDSA